MMQKGLLPVDYIHKWSGNDSHHSTINNNKNDNHFFRGSSLVPLEL